MSGTPTDPRQSPRPRRVRVERGIYRQPNGKYTVCFAFEGKPRFVTVGFDLEHARKQRVIMVQAARRGVLMRIGQLSFAKLAGLWIARLQGRVAAGLRRQRTLEHARYHLHTHLLGALAHRPAASITTQEIAGLIEQLRLAGRSERTIAGALHTLNSIMRFALRNDWIAENPLCRLEHDERPHPTRRPPRVLGREEITALLGACPPCARTLIATALYTGLRISELLALIWADLDLAQGSLHVRSQLPRGRAGQPAVRTPPKSRAARREIPLTPQLSALLARHKQASPFSAPSDWVFATSNGSPYCQRNVARALARALRNAGIDQSTGRVRFHDLRHTYTSHLIIDAGVDVVQVSRLLGHATPETTLRVYTNLFDHARHTASLHTRIAESPFARLLDPSPCRTDSQFPVRDHDRMRSMLHTEIPANDARLSRQPGPGEAVVITRYGKPELVVLRFEDFKPLESLIDHYLAEPPYELRASELAIRAQAIDEQPEGADFDYAGLASALAQ